MAQWSGRLVGNRMGANGAAELVELAFSARGFAPAAASPYTRRATLFADQRGAKIDVFLPAGHWELLLTRHPWSGRALVRDTRTCEIIDLHDAKPEGGILALPVHSSGTDSPVSIEATGLRTEGSRGTQVWFLGARSGTSSFHFESGEKVSKTCRMINGTHGKFLALRTDTGISEGLATAGIWEADSVRIFERYASKARIAIDIGANIGHHTVVLSNLISERGRIFSFEPQMQMYNLLNANLVLNGCANVEPHRVALGATPGRARMHPISYSEFANFGSLGVQPASGEGSGTGELVDILRLDDFLGQRSVDLESVDFIKMDVQSFELFVLQGAQRTLEVGRPALYLEISPYWMRRRGYDYCEIYALLGGLGYTFLGDDLMPHSPPEWDGQSQAEWNVLALPPSRP